MKRIVDYTPDIISRNIKKVRKGLIEIKRYSDSGIRYLVWSWFYVVLFYWIWNIVDPIQGLHYILKWAWDSVELEKKWINEFTDYKNPSLTIMGEPIQQYREQVSIYVKENIRDAWLLLSVPLWLFLLAGFPKWRPLRIDTERRLVYFWLWGQFYITRYPLVDYPLNALHPRMHCPSLRRETHGALVLRIPHESKVGKWTEVDLGIHWAACENQNYVLQNFLNDYLSSPNPAEFDCYFHQEKTLWSDYANRFFYRFSLFPTRGYNEKKTEAKIQTWLANNPEVMTEDDNFDDIFSSIEKLFKN